MSVRPPHHLRALAHAEPRVFWHDSPDAPAPTPPLHGVESTDLVVVGGGLTGLWAAVQAKEDDPSRDVVLVEQERIAFGASGRNGGFLEASLTHGIANGLARWPNEMAELERLGRQNLADIVATLDRHGIDARAEAVGQMFVATEPHQVPWMAEEVEHARRFGWNAMLLDREEVRAEVRSPTYEAGAWIRDSGLLVDPARLCWGLLRTALRLGVRVYEQSRAQRLLEEGAGVRLLTDGGAVRARRAILATSAFPPLVRAIRRYVLPVWDYVLVSEPLGADRLAAVGWANRQGISDSANQFHYYRLTADDRVLWGGYDAVYHFGNGIGPDLAQRPETFELLSGQFFETFPQLEGLAWTHRWGGAIDTCTRFCVTFGTALRGRAAYAVGFTGLGVGASRFGARVALDLADGRATERTRLSLVRSRPRPLPPEPLRYAGVQLTRRALAAADRAKGRRGPWLRALDRLGMGFDS